MILCVKRILAPIYGAFTKLTIRDRVAQTYTGQNMGKVQGKTHYFFGVMKSESLRLTSRMSFSKIKCGRYFTNPV